MFILGLPYSDGILTDKIYKLFAAITAGNSLNFTQLDFDPFRLYRLVS